jgi:hypothetical protein
LFAPEWLLIPFLRAPSLPHVRNITRSSISREDSFKEVEFFFPRKVDGISGMSPPSHPQAIFLIIPSIFQGFFFDVCCATEKKHVDFVKNATRRDFSVTRRWWISSDGITGLVCDGFRSSAIGA